MANTFSQIYLHLVFSTKNREKLIHQDIEERLWAFMGGIAKRHGMTPIQIGGMEDHSHACVGVPTTMSASQAAKHIKGDSSLWIHQEFSELRSFAWQDGYGAFSVSRSAIPDVVDYIKNQREHHEKRFRQSSLRDGLFDCLPYRGLGPTATIKRRDATKMHAGRVRSSRKNIETKWVDWYSKRLVFR